MEAPVERAPSKPVNSLSPVGDWTIKIIFFIYSALCIFPILLLVMVSLSNESDVIVHGYKFIPTKIDLSAYKFVFSDWESIARAYGVSAFVTVVGTALSLIVMALYAYPISRPDFPQRKFFTFFVFFTMLFNGGLVPWYLIYVRFLHLKDSIWSLILPLVMSAFFVLIIRTFFSTTIPAAIIESAKIDGAGEMRIFFRIVLPLSTPVLATVALFSTLNYWNDWFLSLVFITTEKNYSLQYVMYKTLTNIQYLTQHSDAIAHIGGATKFPSETVRMAMAVVGIGPIIFAYPFFQKYFVKGLTVGAVKG
ncbi:carbohydrate ABC transporter permease [Paenibacillus kobensis]|uniref:carbohydrate ABC transporter permease n=1 Tax=Paenibacillus kobensis TaxID=59841 RepID=UPI000FDB4737|nr:carbohydrate ABC transporter permease [Paenibacillus kobensis]